MRYFIAKLDANRTRQGEYKSYAAAAAALRKLDASYFIQGEHRAWFYDEVAR